MRKRGFTLIEIIVVITIIGVLAAILVPSMIGYVRKAKRAADIQTAHQIYNDVELLLAEDDDVYEAVYTTKGSTNNYKDYKLVYDSKTGDEYKLVVVARIDGRKNAAGPAERNWVAVQRENQALADALNDWYHYKSGDSKIKIPIRLTISGNVKRNNDSNTYKQTMDKWYVCYRLGETSRVEIWVGSSKGNGNTYPIYRLYPDPMTTYK